MIEKDFPGAVEACQWTRERANIVTYQFDGLDFPGRAVDPSIRTNERSIKIVAFGARIGTAVKILVNWRTFPSRTVIRCHVYDPVRAGIKGITGIVITVHGYRTRTGGGGRRPCYYCRTVARIGHNIVNIGRAIRKSWGVSTRKAIG